MLTCFSRGGSELGKAWYHAGRYDQKENTFNDVVTAAHGLFKGGYTQPALLAGMASSAGGLALGTHVNLNRV